MGLSHLCLEQGLAALEMLAKHLRAGAEAGKHMLAALAWSQHAAGAGKPALEDAKASLPHLEAAAVFFPAFRKFLSSIGATLCLRPPLC